mmetsp:Transcript_7639/g.21740  ORF Transcript_7639/g.21740 Transcript_7639/m.21740 type:complete len:224 (-) Transcript_7639:675-1346(-)
MVPSLARWRFRLSFFAAASECWDARVRAPSCVRAWLICRGMPLSASAVPSLALEAATTAFSADLGSAKSINAVPLGFLVSLSMTSLQDLTVPNRSILSWRSILVTSRCRPRTNTAPLMSPFAGAALSPSPPGFSFPTSFRSFSSPSSSPPSPRFVAFSRSLSFFNFFSLRRFSLFLAVAASTSLSAPPPFSTSASSFSATLRLLSLSSSMLSSITSSSSSSSS